MKKILISFMLLLGMQHALAQEEIPKISISFSNVDVLDALKSIENQTNYRFYYLDTWLENIKVSGSYQDTQVSLILDDLFKNTVLNFYIAEDNKIFLLQNNQIYESLPEDFSVRKKLLEMMAPVMMISRVLAPCL